MTTSTTPGADTRDMIVVHTALRREFRLVPGLVRETPVGDVARASMLALAPALPRLLMPVLAPREFARYARRVHGTTKP